DDGLARAVRRVRVERRDRVHDVHSSGDLAEDGVLAVEPWARVRGDDEELAPVRIRAGVRHRERAAHDRVVVEVVLEAVAGASGAGSGRVATLDHEVGDDAVEDDAVVEPVSGELAEVLDGLRRLALEKLELDRAVVRVQGRRAHVPGTLSASGSSAPAVGASEPSPSPATGSRKSARAAATVSAERTVATPARCSPRASSQSSIVTVSSSRRGM